MFVRELSLTSFRNYRSAQLHLVPGTTVLVGRNGQGKTNLVESIGYLGTLSSHRTSQDSALVLQHESAAFIRAVVEHDQRSVTMDFQLNASGANRAQLNGNSVRPLELTRYLNTVIFAPEDLAIVRGEPTTRRRFLDQLLVKFIPRMAGVMADYERTLKQRNSLLKSARAARSAQPSTMEVWNERLIQLGSEIILERYAMVDRLQPWLESAYDSIVDADHSPVITYECGLFRDGDPNPPVDREHIVAAFERRVQEVAREELDRGLTLVGPHRDDLAIAVNGLPAKGYASHGETWSMVLALKLAIVHLMRQISAGGDPVVILDDVFAELDIGRRTALAKSLEGIEQVLITAAILEDVPEHLRTNLVSIKSGTIIEQAEGGAES